VKALGRVRRRVRCRAQSAEVHHGPRNHAGADALVVSQPTWASTRAAARSVRRSSIWPRALRGVVVSQDLDELLEFCDSLVVINLEASPA